MIHSPSGCSLVQCIWPISYSSQSESTRYPIQQIGEVGVEGDDRHEPRLCHYDVHIPEPVRSASVVQHDVIRSLDWMATEFHERRNK